MKHTILILAMLAMAGVGLRHQLYDEHVVLFKDLVPYSRLV